MKPKRTSSWRAAAVLIAAVGAAAGVQAQWVKSTITDPMTGKKSHVSFSAISSNEIALPFPYEGPTKGLLGIRIGAIESGIQVGLMIERGQFVCTPGHCSVRVRLDDEEPFVLQASRPHDGSSNLININDSAGKLVGGALRASKIMVEATVYQAGDKILIFDTPGGTAAATTKPPDAPKK